MTFVWVASACGAGSLVGAAVASALGGNWVLAAAMVALAACWPVLIRAAYDLGADSMYHWMPVDQREVQLLRDQNQAMRSELDRVASGRYGPVGFGRVAASSLSASTIRGGDAR